MSDARRVDTHAHIVPPAYRKWLAEKRVDAGGLPIPAWSVEAALEFMETNSIETAPTGRRAVQTATATGTGPAR